MKLIHGDCLDKLKELEDNSVDSIVTDPPYGLSFMGKKWDYDVPTVDIWIECLRVLKSGGHLLAFAGSRTYHRMAVRIEDAGFEIRDQIMWIYGSGFPKSHNIGKAVDKKLGNNRILLESKVKKAANMKSGNFNKGGNYADVKLEITKGNSEWEGWGTALKPAHEPIVMARKPFKGTVVDNVLEWGTGGININDSRIGLSGGTSRGEQGEREKDEKQGFRKNRIINEIDKGRFPANVIFDEEAGKILDEQSGVSKSTGGRSGNKEGVGLNGIYGNYKGIVTDKNPGLGDVGGASRFFYCPKASKKDRNEGLDNFEEKQTKGSIGLANVGNTPTNLDGNRKRKNIHPTVKPTDLMLYLIRLVTPKGKTTLDPFMGSGSTGKAAVRGGFDFIGIEREKEYIDIAQARIEYEQEEVKKKNIQKKLF